MENAQETRKAGAPAPDLSANERLPFTRPIVVDLGRLGDLTLIGGSL